MSATVDAQSYGGSEDFARLRDDAQSALTYFVNYRHSNTPVAKYYLAFGTDPIEELTKLADGIHKQFADCIFFTSKLILERQLVHPSAAQRGSFDNAATVPMVVLPMRP